MDRIRNRWKSLPLSINITVLEGIFDLSPTRGILSDVRICVVLISAVSFAYLQCKRFMWPNTSWDLTLPFRMVFLFRSSGYDRRLKMKSCSRSGEVLLTHRLSEHIFLLGAWHPGQGVVRDQGVFPSLVQNRGSGTQQCHTIQNCCHVKGLVNYAQQSILCGNEASLVWLSAAFLFFINPKGVRDCCGE